MKIKGDFIISILLIILYLLIGINIVNPQDEEPTPTREYPRIYEHFDKCNFNITEIVNVNSYGRINFVSILNSRYINETEETNNSKYIIGFGELLLSNNSKISYIIMKDTKSELGYLYLYNNELNIFLILNNRPCNIIVLDFIDWNR